MPIGARFRRMQRNIAASLEGEGERFSFVSKKGSLSLRRLGDALRSTLEGQSGYDLEDDPIAAFLMADDQASRPAQGVDSQFEAQAADPAFGGPTADDFQSTAPPPMEPGSPVPAQGAESRPAEEQSAPAGAGMVDILQPPPGQPAEGPAQTPGQQPQPPVEASAQAPSSPSPEAVPEGATPPASPSPTDQAAGQAQQAPEATAASPADQVPASSEPPAQEGSPVSSDTQATPDTQDSASASAGQAPPETSSTATDAGGGGEQSTETATSGISASGPMFGDEDKMEAESEEEAAEEEDLVAGGGGGGDSLLDIFRAEDVEENPITALAKTVSDVDINYVLSKAREIAATLHSMSGEGPDAQQ